MLPTVMPQLRKVLAPIINAGPGYVPKRSIVQYALQSSDVQLKLYGRLDFSFWHFVLPYKIDGSPRMLPTFRSTHSLLSFSAWLMKSSRPSQ